MALLALVLSTGCCCVRSQRFHAPCGPSSDCGDGWTDGYPAWDQPGGPTPIDEWLGSSAAGNERAAAPRKFHPVPTRPVHTGSQLAPRTAPQPLDGRPELLPTPIAEGAAPLAPSPTVAYASHQRADTDDGQPVNQLRLAPGREPTRAVAAEGWRARR